MEQTVTFESGSTFTVPTRVVDLYLKAPDVELRLILFLMRHANTSFTKNDLISALDADEERIDKAFKYWCAAGVLYKSGHRYIAERPKLVASDIAPYSPEEISNRITADPQLQFLYTYAEKALAKPLTTSDVSTVFSLVDWNGLPPEVAAMLIGFCTDKGKGLSRIQKMGIEWAEKGIDTYEKAEAFIRAETEKSELQNRIARLFGLTHRALTDAEQRSFCSWVQELGFSDDVIRLAYDRAIASLGKYSYQYIDKILQSWYAQGLHTPEEISACDTSPAQKPARQSRKKRYESAIDKKDLDASVSDSWTLIENELKEDDDK